MIILCGTVPDQNRFTRIADLSLFDRRLILISEQISRYAVMDKTIIIHDFFFGFGASDHQFPVCTCQIIPPLRAVAVPGGNSRLIERWGKPLFVFIHIIDNKHGKLFLISDTGYLFCLSPRPAQCRQQHRS